MPGSGNQPAHQQGRFAGQHQGRGLVRRSQFACGGVDQVEGMLHAVQQFAAGLGEKYPVAATLEQPRAEVFFQGAHGTADGAVGQVQGFAGAGEALQASSGLETAQGAQGRQAAIDCL